MDLLILLLGVATIAILCRRRKKAVLVVLIGAWLLGAFTYLHETESAQRLLRGAASRTTLITIEVQDLDAGGQEAVKTVEVSSEPDIAAFFDVLRLKRNLYLTHHSCECVGNPHVRLHDADGPFTKITFHHGKSIRCSLWSGNVDLRAGAIPKVRRYFESRGVILQQ